MMRELIALLKSLGVETRTLVRVIDSDPPTVILPSEFLRYYAQTATDVAISKAIDDGRLTCEFRQDGAHFTLGENA